MLIIAMSLNLGFSLLFSALFEQIGWAPHGALALANSLATFLEMIGLLILMRRRLGGLQGREIAEALGQAGLASLAMGAGVAAWLAWTAGRSNAVVVIGAVVSGGAIYVLLLVLLRVREIRQLRSLRR